MQGPALFYFMDITKYEGGSQLPIKLEDLAQFVLIGREQLTAVRAGIRALDKLDVAEGVRKQKKEEAQMLAEALLDAEVRIGEILAAMPKAGGGDRRSENFKMGSGEHFENSKLQTAAQLGFNEMQVKRFQTLAANKDLVEAIKQEAREADDLPTRTAVLEAAKHRDAQQKRDFLLQNQMPAEDVLLIERMKAGETVVINIDKHFHAVKFAKDAGIYEQVDRWTPWGNPYTLGPDGNRDEVCDAYQHYFKFKKSLHDKLGNLKGKALGCHCWPLRCHGDYLKKLADEKGN